MGVYVVTVVLGLHARSDGPPVIKLLIVKCDRANANICQCQSVVDELN